MPQQNEAAVERPTSAVTSLCRLRDQRVKDLLLVVVKSCASRMRVLIQCIGLSMRFEEFSMCQLCSKLKLKCQLD